MDIMILEDEPKTASLLREFLENVHVSNRIVNISDSIESALSFLQSTSREPDLFFMDIQLADGLSFEIFKKIKITRPVVFCTAYEQYALEAFKANGIDYILKPFEEVDILAAFDKLRLLGQNGLIDEEKADSLIQAAGTSESPARVNTSFLIRFRDKMIPVPVREIAVFALENENVWLYHFNREKYALFKTIDEIDSSLDRRMFFRINRQMILNRGAIVDIEPYFNRKVIVNLKSPTREKTIVSRLKVASFLEWVEWE